MIEPRSQNTLIFSCSNARESTKTYVVKIDRARFRMYRSYRTSWTGGRADGQRSAEFNGLGYAGSGTWVSFRFLAQPKVLEMFPGRFRTDGRVQLDSYSGLTP